jgi:hypothetical protein
MFKLALLLSALLTGKFGLGKVVASGMGDRSSRPNKNHEL